MAVNIYRNQSLIQMETYETDSARADEMIDKLRSKWAWLREKGYAGDYPVELLRGDESSNNGSKVKIVEMFRWRSEDEQVKVQDDTRYHDMRRTISSLGGSEPSSESYTQAIRGFNKNFPPRGGVELLRGVCSCLLTIDSMVKDFPMSVKNGIVLMHRSPQMDLDGDGVNEMYLKILMHGGEMDIQGSLGPIRVEQNFNRPNDGLVKSNGDGNDFPGTAIWRVAWKIQTSLGAVLTDPDRPLIFGPAAVTHYPPVGTHFHSPTGPVALIHEDTGKRVGTLTPGELTAFDIVVTKDDEVLADILNTPPDDIFDLLNEHVAHMDDYASRHIKVPAGV